MYELAHVTNTVLYRARNDSMPITPMKLQKLVYFLYREFLCRTGIPPFAERFEVWKYGPVLTDVYQSFKDYGPNPIKRYMPDANGGLRVVDLERDAEFAMCFNTVWNAYSGKTGIELSRITHQPGTAWYKAYQRDDIFLSDTDILAEGSCEK